jgi:hypothetical protein
MIFNLIYLPSLGKYIYRSLLATIAIALIFEGFAGTSFGMYYGGWTGTFMAYWTAGSFFIVDIPFWVRRKVAKLTNKQ